MKKFFESASLNAEISQYNQFSQERKKISNETYSDHFMKLVSEEKFIDKSMLIELMLSDPSSVKTFIYPLNCGKSANISMLYTFLCNLVNNKKQEIFSQLKISKSANSMKHMGQYSVIYLDFSSMKPKNYDELVKLLSTKIAALFREHNYLTDTLDADYVDDYNILKNADQNLIPEWDLTNALLLLTRLITDFNRTIKCCENYEKPIVLIDGYDIPTSFLEEDKRRCETLISVLLSKALKGNQYLWHAMVMGSSRNNKILPNNCRVYSIDYSSYSKYFGLDEQEAKSLLEKYNLAEEYFELKADFLYRENRPAFNPETVLNYIQMKIDKNILSI